MPRIDRQKYAFSALRAFCLGLPLILVFSLAAAGAFAFAPCQGDCCCCKTSPQAQHRQAMPTHAKPPDESDCCSTSPPPPLHLQSCRTIDPPIAISSIQPHHPEIPMSAGCAVGEGSHMNLRVWRGAPSPTLPAEARSAPIYLLKQSLLC
jgi:hypothetical protein